MHRKKLKNYKKVKMHALKTNAGPTVSVTFFLAQMTLIGDDVCPKFSVR